MKNIAKAVSLVLICLLGILPTIQAQNTDTKAAPDLPNFKVTLGVKSNAGGTFEASVANRKLTYSSTKDTCQIVYGEKPTIKLTANPQYMLESFTVNGKAETLDTTFIVGTSKVNTYTWTPNSGLTAKTDIAITWKEKQGVTVMVGNTEQIVNASSGATAVTVMLKDRTLAYYTEKECTNLIELSAIKTAGTYYVKITSPETATCKAISMIVPLVISNKKVLEIVESNKPTCGTQLLQGQPLSAAVITAKAGDVKVKDVTPDHIIKGTWSWANPNMAVMAGPATGSTGTTSYVYEAIFTPDSVSMYNSISTTIGVAALTVTTVTVQQTDGGVVAIKGATADNKYIGTTDAAKKDLAATATPKAGYKFVKWVNPNDDASTGKETVVTKTGITATNGLVISAEFAKATRKVKIGSVTNGTLKVMNGASEVATNTAVPVGTTLTIVATPNEGYQVEKVGYTAIAADAAGRDAQPETVATSFVVGGTKDYSYAVSATFSAIPASEFMVNVAEMQNGTLLLKSGDVTVSPNSAVEKDAIVSVIALPNRGYKLGTLTANNQDIKVAASTKVTAETTIAATFEKESYTVAVSAPTGVTISNAPAGSTTFGTILRNVTAHVSDANKYRLISLLVDNQSVANGSDVVVDGPKTISAQVQKLSTLQILNEQTTEVTYDGKPQEYAVLTANGLGGFKVLYGNSEAAPTDKGTYTLTITRPADKVYATFSETRTLIVHPGVPGIIKIPFASEAIGAEVSGSSTVAGKWSKTKPNSAKSLRAAGSLSTIYFIPNDKNLSVVEVTTPANQSAASGLGSITITMPTTITGGSLVLMVGDVAVKAGITTYKGQTFSVKATPEPGYSVNQTALNTINNSLVNISTDKTISADGVFTTKTALSVSASQTLTASYTGSPIAVTPSLPAIETKWVISYKQNKNPAIPQNIGSYDVWASCNEGKSHKAYDATQVGTLTIAATQIDVKNVTLPSASSVLKDAALSTSLLSGGEVKIDGKIIAGTFAWSTTTNTTVNEAKAYSVTFTPEEATNYTAPTTGLEVYVSLLDVVKHTMKVVTVKAGTAVITDASGAVVKNGELVSEGMQLTVKAAVGSKAIDKVEVTPNVSITTDGLTTTFVTPKADFTVTVTFKTDGEVTPPTPAEKYAVYVTSAGKGTLKVMNGTKEVKNGDEVAANTELTITATATKGNKLTSLLYNGSTIASGAKKKVTEATTISAVFTAEVPTGLEEVVANTRVYALNGRIVVEPAATMQVRVVGMTGQTLYSNDRLATMTQIPAQTGIYIVSFSDGKTTVTKKVGVR